MSQRSARAMVPSAAKMIFRPRSTCSSNSTVGKSCPKFVLSFESSALESEDEMCGAVLETKQPTGRKLKSRSSFAQSVSGRGATKSALVVMKFIGANHCLLVSNSACRSTPKVSFTALPRGARMLEDIFNRSSSAIKSLKLPIPGKVTKEAFGRSSFNATSKPWGAVGSYSTTDTFNSRHLWMMCSPQINVLFNGQIARSNISLSSGKISSTKISERPHSSNTKSGWSL